MLTALLREYDPGHTGGLVLPKWVHPGSLDEGAWEWEADSMRAFDVEACVQFLQHLIQTRSLPGREEEIAGMVHREMENLGFDQVREDEAGNVIGLIRGQGDAPAVMLNTHLDHVDVGDESRWPFPPFGGEIHEGRVWGRGAMDIKGPLAAQVYGVAPLVQETPPGDVYVSSVVQEEVGGLGARHLSTHLQIPLVVVGEASQNRLRRGHRGRTELTLHVQGRSVHASVPETGVNPLFVVAGFLRELASLEMAEDPELGSSSLAATLIRTDQTSSNVLPGEAWLTLDWRNIPGETGEDVRQRLEETARKCLIEGSTAAVEVPTFQLKSFAGLEMEYSSYQPAYVIPESHPALSGAKQALDPVTEVRQETELWRFATDGGHFAEAGMLVIGFAPGHESLAHTVDESISIADLDVGMQANLALARDWPILAERAGF